MGQFLIRDHHNSRQQVSSPPLKRTANYQANERTVLQNLWFLISSDAIGTSFSFIAYWLQLRQIRLISDLLT